MSIVGAVRALHVERAPCAASVRSNATLASSRSRRRSGRPSSAAARRRANGVAAVRYARSSRRAGSVELEAAVRRRARRRRAGTVEAVGHRAGRPAGRSDGERVVRALGGTIQPIARPSERPGARRGALRSSIVRARSSAARQAARPPLSATGRSTRRGGRREGERASRTRPLAPLTDVSVRPVKALHSLAEVEGALRDEGFFEGGADGLVADVYLGYGLSRSLPAHGRARSAGAVPAAAAAVRIRPADEPLPRRGLVRDRRVGADLGRRRVRRRRRGCSGRDRAPATSTRSTSSSTCRRRSAAIRPGSPAALAPLRPLEPRPLVGDGWAIVSASPELFLARRGRRVWTMPIKGTRPLGARRASASEKDAAEHVMIVDLERNDLSRVCEPGTVRWPELMVEHALAGVEHLVSTRRGTAPRGRSAHGAARGDLPGRLGHRRAEDLGHRPHRRARAGRPRRVDGRARPRLAERRPRPRADDPYVRGRRGPDPPVGRRRDRLGLRPGGGDRGVVVKARPLLGAIGAPLREPGRA